MVSHQALGEPLMREVIREYCQPVLTEGQLQGEALLAAFKPRGYSECIVVAGGEDRKWVTVHHLYLTNYILFGHAIINMMTHSVQPWPTKRPLNLFHHIFRENAKQFKSTDFFGINICQFKVILTQMEQSKVAFWTVFSCSWYADIFCHFKWCPRQMTCLSDRWNNGLFE